MIPPNPCILELRVVVRQAQAYVPGSLEFHEAFSLPTTDFHGAVDLFRRIHEFVERLRDSRDLGDAQ